MIRFSSRLAPLKRKLVNIYDKCGKMWNAAQWTKNRKYDGEIKRHGQ